MQEKSVRSAVIISPPTHFWPPIQAIRSEHDRAYDRWMPHINLLYPFVPEPADGFTEVKHKLQAAFKKGNIKPFQILFSKESFGYFSHDRKSTVWLKPLYIKATEIDRETTKQLEQGIKKIPEVKNTKPAAQPACYSAKIQVTEPLIESPYAWTTNITSEVGLSALHKAVWTENDPPQKPPANLTPGLDCLRYAVWGSENEIDSVKSTQTKLHKYTQKVHDNPKPKSVEPVKPQLPENKEILKAEKQKEGYGSFPVRQHERGTSTDVHRLQSVLERVFPFCDDLSKKSESGFSPHLTLGQCDTKNVGSFIERLKENWKDFYFTVENVHVISRSDSSPFAIKESVLLG